jgi:hypothetical protein
MTGTGTGLRIMNLYPVVSKLTYLP